MKIVMRSPADLKPFDRNARTHSADQVGQLAESIRAFGFTNPVLVTAEGQIVAGHGRVEAAKVCELEKIPTVVVGADWSPEQMRAYVLADNQLALNAGWDNEILRAELDELRGVNFEIGLIGFSEAELAAILADKTQGLTDPDDAPEPPMEPVTVLGDVWVLGRHRIVCGDATNVDDWAKLHIGKDFVLFSSPPYNVGDASGLRYKYQKGVPQTKKLYDKYSDDLEGEKYADMLSSVVSAAFGYVDAIALNVQPLAGAKRPLLRWMDGHSQNLVDVITWDKGRAAPHIKPGIMSSRFEWIVILSKDENASRVIPFSSWQGKYSNVYQAPPQTRNEYAAIHGATFPVHLPEYMIGDLMNRCRGVVDCFLGTGATIIAAENLGRDGCGIELSPAYVDVAVMRWQNFTGKLAVLEGTDKTFQEVMLERAASEAA